MCAVNALGLLKIRRQPTQRLETPLCTPEPRCASSRSKLGYGPDLGFKSLVLLRITLGMGGVSLLSALNGYKGETYSHDFIGQWNMPVLASRLISARRKWERCPFIGSIEERYSKSVLEVHPGGAGVLGAFG